MPNDIDKWLARAGHLAMVVIAVAAVVAVLRPLNKAAPAPAGYEKGERIDIPPTALSGRALLIATRSTCPFCTASMEFYRKVNRAQVLWIAVDEDVRKNEQYLISNGVKPEKVLARSELRLSKVSNTPTVILLDRDGVVQGSWIGRLRPDQESNLLSILANPASTSGPTVRR